MKLLKLIAVGVAFPLIQTFGFSADATELTAQQKYDALASKGIFAGVNGEAALDQNMSRAQFARVAALILGLEDISATDTNIVTEKPFSDVELGLWYTDEIAAAKKAGVFVGNADGTFNPKGDVTVQELAVVAAGLLGLERQDDAQQGGGADWAAGYVQAIVNNNVLFPTNYTEAAKRADLASFAFIADSMINPGEPKTSVVAALKNTLTYRGPNGKAVTIELGTGAIVDDQGNVLDTMSLKDLIALEAANGTAGNPNSLTTGLMNVVDQLSTRVAAGFYGAQGADILATVVNTLAGANPAAAAGYVNTAIQNIAANTDMAPADKNAAVTLLVNHSMAALTPQERSRANASIRSTLTQNRSKIGMSVRELSSLVTTMLRPPSDAAPIGTLTEPINIDISTVSKSS